MCILPRHEEYAEPQLTVVDGKSRKDYPIDYPSFNFKVLRSLIKNLPTYDPSTKAFKALDQGVQTKIEKKCLRKTAKYQTDGVIVHSNDIMWVDLSVLKYNSRPLSALDLIYKSDLDPSIRMFKFRDPEQCMESLGVVDKLIHLVNHLNTSGKKSFISVDVETFDPITPGGKLGLNHFKGKIRLIQLFIPTHNLKVVFDFGARDEHTYVAGFGDKLTELFLAARALILQNALFDMGFLTVQLGVQFTTKIKILDTQLLSQNFWAGIKQFNHGLGNICDRLGLKIDKTLQKSDFGAPLHPAQINYGVDDTVFTFECFVKLSKLMSQSVSGNWQSALTDCDFLPLLNEMRVKGYPVDLKELEATLQETRDFIDIKSAEFEELSGTEFTKRAAVLVYLQEKYGVDVFPNLQKATYNQHLDKYDVKLLADCKFVAARLPYAERIPLAVIDGAVRGKFRCLATQGMGRTACSTEDGLFVQLQNPSKESKDYPEVPDIRRVFVAGYNKKRKIKRKVAVVDLKSCHLLIALAQSNQLDQIEMVKTGVDSHCYNAAVLVRETMLDKYPWLASPEQFKEAYDSGDKVAKMLRDLAKNGIYTSVNFGSGRSLQITLQKFKIYVELSICNLAMEALTLVIPNWVSLCKGALKIVNKSNYHVKQLAMYDLDYEKSIAEDEEEAEERSNKLDAGFTVFFGNFALMNCCSGRWRYIPKLERDGKYGVYGSVKLNDLSSFLVQAPEADIMKIAGFRWMQWREERFQDPNIDCWISVIAHDEYNIIADEDIIGEASKKLMELLDEESKLSCKGLISLVEPEKWEKTICDRWSEK
jgi:3'-5' exonuclease